MVFRLQSNKRSTTMIFMATPFTHTPGVDPALVVTDCMIAIDHELTHLPAKSAIQLIEFCRNRLAASESRVLSDRYENGASDRDVEDLAGSAGGTSKKEAKKRASRAKAANANPGLADKMESGDLSAEQADVIAEAAAETDGAAACDEKLIADVAGTSPEQGRKKAKKFVNDRRDADDVQTKHDRQRRRRGWYSHRLPNGDRAITFHGDDISVGQMEDSIFCQSDVEYHDDGGRDVPRDKHPRTGDQRGFDAAHKLITRGGQTSQDAKAGPRDVVHVNVTLDQLTGKDPSPILTSNGKPLPRSVFNELFCGAEIIGHIFSGDGELLWQSRKKRLATTAQINGLIARDGGCVQCGAHHNMCVAHHLLPWHAPGQGKTDIDNLALLCGDCHTRVHQRKLTLFYDRETLTWNTRPATPNEIPPDNRNQSTGKTKIGKYANKPARANKPGGEQRLKPRFDEQRNNVRLGALF